MTPRSVLIAAVVAVVVLLLGVRAIDRMGRVASLHDSALTTAEEVRRQNATLAIALSQSHARQRAAELRADSLSAIARTADHRSAAALARVDSARAVRRTIGAALPLAHTGSDSVPLLVAALVVSDRAEALLRSALVEAQTAIAARDSAAAAMQSQLTLLTGERDSLTAALHREAEARAQLVGAVRASAPACRLLPGVPCPPRSASAIGGAVVAALLLHVAHF